jgi:hypothetical protein
MLKPNEMLLQYLYNHMEDLALWSSILVFPRDNVVNVSKYFELREELLIDVAFFLELYFSQNEFCFIYVT